MRLLIIADDAHMSVAIEAAQFIINHDAGSSITITDEEQAGELISYNGYDYVLKNPDLTKVLEIINAHKCK